MKEKQLIPLLMVTVVAVGLGLLILLGPFSKAVAGPKIKWFTYEEGLALAKQEQKKIFVHFYADWCAYCKKMDKETLRDPAVIEYLTDHFISIRVNSDKKRQIARDYFIRGLPSTWFVSPDGEKISSLPGYIEAKMLLSALKFIHTDSYKEVSFKDFLNKKS